MKEKVILCTLENGEEWAVPLQVIADNRAKYYAEKDPDTTYQREFDFVMEDSYEGIDWFCNNMNPDEVQTHFRKISEAKEMDFNEKINSAEKRISVL